MVAPRAGKEPFDIKEIVSSLSDLVKLIMESKDKKIVDPKIMNDIYKQLGLLKQLVDIVHEAHLKALRDLNITDEDLERFRNNADSLPEDQKKLFFQLEDMKQNCQKVRDELFQSLQKNKREWDSVKKEYRKAVQEEKIEKKRKRKAKEQGG